MLSLAAAASNAVFLVGTTRLLNNIETPVYNTYVSTIVALAIGLLALVRAQLSLDFDFQALMAIVCSALLPRSWLWRPFFGV